MRARTMIRQHGWVDIQVPDKHEFRDVYDWCVEIMQPGTYLIRSAQRKRYDDVKYKIAFKNSSDATLFQLTWG